MLRKLIGSGILLLSMSFLSAPIAHRAIAMQIHFQSITENTPSIFSHSSNTSLQDGELEYPRFPEQQAKNPRPTSTPIPIPPPPDPGSINIMVFFGVVVVFIILFGVWINRQRSVKKES